MSASNKQRLDQALVGMKLVPTRSQAESFIGLGSVTVNGKVVTKSGQAVSENDDIKLTAAEQYVSRAGLKLASVAKVLKLELVDKVMLDVGSSTGGFTDYALKHGAKKVLAVEVGTNQLHSSLHGDPRIELHEKTDIRDFRTTEHIDVVVIDVSFISLRDILPAVARLSSNDTVIVAMVKPQFEATNSGMKHKGVIKNDRMRRDILKDFEAWSQSLFKIIDKSDSEVHGSKGNVERFYKLKKLTKN